MGHFARKCSLDCKCSVCGPNNKHKHATPLHDIFGGIRSAELGAAGVESMSETGYRHKMKLVRAPYSLPLKN